MSWERLSGVDGCGMTHDTELMAAHQGAPSIQVQAETHGAPMLGGGIPAEDKGPRPGDVVGAVPPAPVTAMQGAWY